MLSRQIVEVLAVASSIPALIMSLLVLLHWVPEARRAVWERRDAADWLVLGVTISFVGMFTSMMYWSSYWVLTRLDLPAAEWFATNGPAFNIVARQGVIIVSAWCHLKAYDMFSRGMVRDPTFQLKWTLAVGALVAVIVSMIGGWYNV